MNEPKRKKLFSGKQPAPFLQSRYFLRKAWRAIIKAAPCLVALCLSVAAFSRCSSYTKVKNSSAQSRAHEPIPAADAAADVAAYPEYRLGFGDVLEIKFFNNTRFNETVAVRPDGRISLEKMDDVFVLDKTPGQLDSLITAAYARFVLEPEVTVFVRQFGGNLVHVLGEVKAPGGYPLQKDMTLLQALTAAGGPLATAKLKSVLLLRETPDRQIQAERFDLSKALRAGHGEADLSAARVRAQDVIYVPKTFIASTSAFLKQIYDGVLPPLDIYLRAVWWSNR